MATRHDIHRLVELAGVEGENVVIEPASDATRAAKSIRAGGDGRGRGPMRGPDLAEFGHVCDLLSQRVPNSVDPREGAAHRENS